MALKPPARGGSSSGIRQGIRRRRNNLGEMLVKQSTGAARAVLADMVLAAEPKAASGTVTGSTTYSGTIAGTKGAQGVTASEIAYSGVITGTAYDPNPPEPSAPPAGGMSPYRRQQIAAAQLAALQAQQAPVEHKSGSVKGVTVLRGTVAGRRGTSGRTLVAPVTYRGHAAGRKETRGVIYARIETRARITGTGITAVSTAELRRMRDDAELLLLI